MRKLIEGRLAGVEQIGGQEEIRQVSITGFVWRTAAFIICTLVSIAPLTRLAGTDHFRGFPISAILTVVGGWLPVDLHLTSNTLTSQLSTDVILFLALTALSFIAYLLGAWFISRQPQEGDYRRVLRLVWSGAILVGLIFVFAPAMLSHDAFVYAGYGRLLSSYHVNPYFTPPAAFPADPITRIDDWRNALAAYGPLWLLVCALGALVSGSNPLAYVLFYRLLALGAHLCNIFLVASTLRTAEQSPRTVAMGTLLYAWNPLVIEESGLGGHSDTLMVTFILLGILLLTRLEHGNTATRPRIQSYLPALVSFTLAILIKFTALPLVVLFLVLLVRKTLTATPSASSQAHRWSALVTLIGAGFVSAVILLGFYLPFWIGHSIGAIIYSLTSPPSANSAYGSILAAIQGWTAVHGLPSQGWAYAFVSLFSRQKTWSLIDLVTVILLMILGAAWIWRRPSPRALALAALAVFLGLLIVTPWFFPWYVAWIVGLAAVCLPALEYRAPHALVTAALTFSASAFFIYLFFHNQPPIGGWRGLTFLTTIGPPLLALLMSLIFSRKENITPK